MSTGNHNVLAYDIKFVCIWTGSHNVEIHVDWEPQSGVHQFQYIPYVDWEPQSCVNKIKCQIYVDWEPQCCVHQFQYIPYVDWEPQRCVNEIKCQNLCGLGTTILCD